MTTSNRKNEASPASRRGTRGARAAWCALLLAGISACVSPAPSSDEQARATTHANHLPAASTAIAPVAGAQRPGVAHGARETGSPAASRTESEEHAGDPIDGCGGCSGGSCGGGSCGCGCGGGGCAAGGCGGGGSCGAGGGGTGTGSSGGGPGCGAG
jgi:hypothetical protein